MAAAPVIVDRTPVAVIYGALRTDDPLGDRDRSRVQLDDAWPCSRTPEFFLAEDHIASRCWLKSSALDFALLQ